MYRFVALILVLLLQACAEAPIFSGQEIYDVAAHKALSEIRQWHFEGRMAITSAEDSWSANVEWRHDPEHDTINLSGPLGQGTLLIKLDGSHVSIDDGDGNVEQSDDADSFVMQKLGVFVPVRALVYWVIGLPDPDRSVSELKRGFEQDGWRIDYKEWQSINNQQLPRKLDIQNKRVKLKLVFDQWKVVNG